MTPGRWSGSRRSSRPAATHGILLLQAQLGSFSQAAFNRAAIEPDIAKLTVVETAEQYEAGLARALLDQGRDEMIDEPAGAGKEMPDRPADRAGGGSIASGVIQ